MKIVPSLKQNKMKKFIVFLIPVFVLSAHLQKRPVNHEGGQSYIQDINQKIDWWGSILPIITPNDRFRQGSLIISIISLAIFLIGVNLTVKYSNITKKHVFPVCILFFSGYNFVIPNSRDAFLMSFAMLSFGLINAILSTRKFYLIGPLSLCLVLMVSFKYVTAVSIVVILVYYFLRNFKFRTTLKYTFIITATFMITISGIAFDQSLANIANLKKSFPEQQPIYQDLATFYCWSDDPVTRQYALNAIKPVMIAQNPSDICLTLRPNSWGYLVSGGNFLNSGISAPLQKITDRNEDKRPKIIQGWIKTMVHDPMDYIQFKLISATQVIAVGNPFKYPLDISKFTNESDKISENTKPNLSAASGFSGYVWKIDRILMLVIGSTYVFSLLILFTLLFLASNIRRRLSLKKELITFLFLINLLNLVILSISYVSDEARYIFPIIFLTYLILIIEINLETKFVRSKK
jgi:hypothetical protein